MRSLFNEKGSAGIEGKGKTITHKFYTVFISKGSTVEELGKNYEEHEEQPKP